MFAIHHVTVVDIGSFDRLQYNVFSVLQLIVYIAD